MPAASSRQWHLRRGALSSAQLVGLVSGTLLPEAWAAEVRVTDDTKLRAIPKRAARRAEFCP